MILVFGKTGQVSSKLGAFEDVRLAGRDEADLSDPATCSALIERLKPEAVINAAAYTAVDKAESEPDLARTVNSEAPGAMAQTCAGLEIPLVHISTDYVFAGTGETPYKPSDPCQPGSVYASTKHAGELAIAAARGPHAILRTSWVFSETGNNFLKTMLKLAATRDELSIVGDQIGGPTPADAIADACYKIAHELIQTPEKSGIYHLSGTPNCSWADFARAIFETAGLECEVEDIPTADYPTPAKRPLNSRLDCSATTENFGVERPDWRASLAPIISKIRT